MPEYAGQGDPARTLALLWGRTAPGKRGPSQTSSVAEIVETAIRIADRDGLPGLSMRAVGRELGRTAMSLYTYVPSRAELVDLMYDEVHRPLAVEQKKIRVWRKAAIEWCRGLRAIYLAHPWVLQVSSARPVLGPNEQAVLEALLRILAAGKAPIEARPAATSALFSIVRGAAQQSAEAIRAAEATGQSDQQWWAARAAALQEVAPDFAARFPESVAIAAHQAKAGGDEPWVRAAELAFEGAVTLILDGLATNPAADTVKS
ncbi:TetR/AcrR family transcriptional regulator C-terminal domain-containing protein [Kribbella deserti]|uniref:TetR/AcrR family transcriptional regulator C-terminal domain-containing protein n=1 Tax=Kribbella deserti TaxID=1926257 RepID=A0ABV6QT71_9ACTN